MPTGLRQAAREDAPRRAAPDDQVVEIVHRWLLCVVTAHGQQWHFRGRAGAGVTSDTRAAACAGTGTLIAAAAIISPDADPRRGAARALRAWEGRLRRGARRQRRESSSPRVLNGCRLAAPGGQSRHPFALEKAVICRARMSGLITHDRTFPLQDRLVMKGSPVRVRASALCIPLDESSPVGPGREAMAREHLPDRRGGHGQLAAIRRGPQPLRRRARMIRAWTRRSRRRGCRRGREERSARQAHRRRSASVARRQRATHSKAVEALQLNAAAARRKLAPRSRQRAPARAGRAR